MSTLETQIFFFYFHYWHSTQFISLLPAFVWPLLVTIEWMCVCGEHLQSAYLLKSRMRRRRAGVDILNENYTLFYASQSTNSLDWRVNPIHPYYLCGEKEEEGKKNHYSSWSKKIDRCKNGIVCSKRSCLFAYGSKRFVNWIDHRMFSKCKIIKQTLNYS